ncbi:MAG: peptidyl-prolyl cis-trans isomerase [Planctomycetes bacterium]|nr:peptidyl-prolyl cis-trans isomerase [Planctomycetota bacterium]
MTVRSCLLLFLLVLSGARAFAQTGPDNEVLGVVNSKAITLYDILADLRKLEVDISKLSVSEQQRAIADTLTSKVLEIVKEEAAKRSGISLAEEDYVNIRNRTIEATFGGDAGFAEFLRDQGMTEEQWDTDFRRRQEQYAWLRVVSGRGGGKLSRDLRPLHDLTIRPKEMRDYYTKHLDSEFTFQDEAVVRVIQVYFSSGPRSTEGRAKQLLEGLKRKLATKADFAVLAEKNSEHSTKSSGGLVGAVVKGKGAVLPEAVEEAIFAPGVNEGDVLGPIKNINSYWLVKVEKREEARVLDFAEAQDLIRQKLYTEKSNRVLIKIQLDLVKEAYITPPDLKRRVVGALELKLTR